MKHGLLHCILAIALMSLTANAAEVKEDPDDQPSKLCVIHKGNIQLDSEQQVTTLQDLMKASPECKFYGVTWQYMQGQLETFRFLVHDNGEKPHLTRVKITTGLGMDDMSYVRWLPVTRESILKDDPADGFDQPNMRTGKGKPTMPSAEDKFVASEILTAFE